MNILVWSGIGCMGFTALMTLWAALQSSAHGGQSVRESIIESWTNIAIGFGINYAANLAVLPLAGFNVSAGGAFWIGCIFTGISVLRSFAVRRWFNRRMTNRHNWHKPAHKGE